MASRQVASPSRVSSDSRARNEAGIPILSGYLGELPVEGHSIDPQRHARLASAHRLGLLLEKDDFLRLLVSQIYIEPHGDLRMEPRIGKHSIIVGDSTGLESKLENLEAFYRQGLVRGPWDRYELINLKYKDQVVCTKRKTYEII
ncbi:MAG TPA: hypothetical protein P5248_09220 [Bacteroidales bacterium]|nr:hypothetical protein [Bacteroidales bacterium]